MKLTKIQIEKVKLEHNKTKQTLPDGDGLRLIINKSGKYWEYRKRMQGKDFYFNLGTYPSVSLKQARLTKDKLKINILEVGIIEAKEKFNNSLNKSKDYFEDISNEWLQTYKVTPKNISNAKGRLKNYILPYFKGYKIKEIKHIYLSNFFKTFKNKEATAYKVKVILNHIFKYALNSGYIEFNPVQAINLSDLGITYKPTHFKGTNNPMILNQYLQGIDKTNKTIQSKLCFKLIFYTTLRQGTARQLEWNDIDFEKELINIPAEKMKTKEAFIIPFTKQIKNILAELEPFKGYGSYLFSINAKNPISETSLRYLKEDIEANQGILNENIINIHGIRHSFSTIIRDNMEIHGIKNDLVFEKSLSHKDKNTIRDIYNNSTLLKERKVILQWWNDIIDNPNLITSS